MYHTEQSLASATIAAGPKKSYAHFYIKRQQFIDEITFDHGNSAVPALTALERNVGRMIAKSVNPETGESFEHASSFAKRLGGKTKVRHVENAMRILEARDWLRIEPRGSRTYLSIRVKGHHGRHSTKLPGKQYEGRQRQISAALECKELSQSARCAYVGLLSICDKDGEWRDGQREAAAILGMSWTTFNRCVQRLQKLNLMHVDAQTLMPLPIVSVVKRNGRLVEKPFAHWPTTGPEVAHGHSNSPEKSVGSTPTPVTPETPIPSPSDSAPSPAANERIGRPSAFKKDKVSFAWEEWERFHQLVGLIVDHSGGERNHKTVAGIMAVSGALPHRDYPGNEVGTEVYGYPYYPDELQKFAAAGLLIRKGQRYYISKLGWHGYNWFEQRQSQKEAA